VSIVKARSGPGSARFRRSVEIGAGERGCVGRKKTHLTGEGGILSETAPKNLFVAADREGCPPEGQLAPKWFAVYTWPRHEKRVAQYLSVRTIEHYLPLYHARRKWADGSIVTLDLPLFPGYLFVRIDRTERVRVLEVPGVLTVVGGTGGEPAPLAGAEIDALRAGLSLRQAEPHPLLTAGQRARIRSGALAGMEGVVVRQKSSLRVVLTIDLIQQSVAVEVDAAELELLGAEVVGDTSGNTVWPRMRTA
jgi:transcription antitermination factor NusG